MTTTSPVQTVRRAAAPAPARVTRTAAARSPRGWLAALVAASGLGWTLASGCAVASFALPAAAGAGSLAYSEYRDGEYVVAVAADRAVCELALNQSCQHFSLVVTACQREPQCTAVTLRNVRGDRLKVWLSDIGHDCTAVYIRAGLWGDDLCSRQLARDLIENVRGLRLHARAGHRP